MKTQAQRFSAQFDDDGQVFDTDDGRSLQEVADHMNAETERDFDKKRFTFSDDSVITELAGGWDFGYPDCWCWQGVGHNDDCPESPHYERPIEEDIKEFFNCRDAARDADGDIWIEDPQAGHWISAEKKAEFEKWLETR